MYVCVYVDEVERRTKGKRKRKTNEIGSVGNKAQKD